MRRLIINADDFGDTKFNPSIVAGFEQGFITSTSLLVGRSGAAEAAAIANANSLAVGLHLNLTAGEPAAEPNRIRSLLDANGSFLGERAFRDALRRGSINANEMSIEGSAQLDRFQELVGALPSHVDGHHHVHVERDVATQIAPLLEIRGITKIRMPVEAQSHYAHLEPSRRAWADRLMTSARQAMPIYESCGCRWPGFVGMGLGWEDCTIERLRSHLSDLPHGLPAEYMVHVARVGDLPESDTGYRRYHEFDTLQSAGFRDVLADMEIELISFTDL